jgi:hypothetical protein
MARAGIPTAVSFVRDEPPREPTPERVAGGRRGAILVVVVALVVVSVFLWKPWQTDSATPAATVPTRSLLVAVVPSPSIQPTASASTAVAASLPPLTEDPQEQAAFDLGTVALLSDGPFVTCSYRFSGTKLRPLGQITVTAPTITTGSGVADGAAKHVEWHVELQTNTMQGLFSDPWLAERSSDSQVWDFSAGRQVKFHPMKLNVPGTGLSPTAIVRVAVIVDWTARDGATVASQQLYPVTYGVPDSNAPVVTGGCPIEPGNSVVVIDN